MQPAPFTLTPIISWHSRIKGLSVLMQPRRPTVFRAASRGAGSRERKDCPPLYTALTTPQSEVQCPSLGIPTQVRHRAMEPKLAYPCSCMEMDAKADHFPIHG